MQGSERSVMYKHILIPTDGSELSMKAVEHGILFGKGAEGQSHKHNSHVAIQNLRF